MDKKLRILIIVGVSILLILGGFTLLQSQRIIKLPCLLNKCPFGGTCSRFEGRHVCLNGYEDGTICEYCKSKECDIGESFPLYINCWIMECPDLLGPTPTTEQLCDYSLQRLQSVLGDLSNKWKAIYQSCSKGPTNNQITLLYKTDKTLTKEFLEDLEIAFEKRGFGVLRKGVQDKYFGLDEIDGKGFLSVLGQFGEKEFSVIGERECRWIKETN